MGALVSCELAWMEPGTIDDFSYDAMGLRPLGTDGGFASGSIVWRVSSLDVGFGLGQEFVFRQQV